MKYKIGDKVILSTNKQQMQYIGLESYSGKEVIISEIYPDTKNYSFKPEEGGGEIIITDELIFGTAPKYFTNPQKRCCLCNAREIVTIINTTVNTNLKIIGSRYYCKDKEECKQNIAAENTTIEIEANDNTKKITVKEGGKTMLEVEKNGYVK